MPLSKLPEFLADFDNKVVTNQNQLLTDKEYNWHISHVHTYTFKESASY